MTTQSWLWPDRTIGKRESRQLREEHNELVNEHAAMRDALRGCVQALETHIADEARRAMLVPNVLCPCTDHELATARTILARIEGEK